MCIRDSLRTAGGWRGALAGGAHEHDGGVCVRAAARTRGQAARSGRAESRMRACRASMGVSIRLRRGCACCCRARACRSSGCRAACRGRSIGRS
eukprot:1528047-Prymnesium_polylepis.1